MSIEITPMQEKYFEGAAALITERYRTLRLQIPPAELAQCAMCYEGRPPGVATR